MSDSTPELPLAYRKARKEACAKPYTISELYPSAYALLSLVLQLLFTAAYFAFPFIIGIQAEVESAGSGIEVFLGLGLLVAIPFLYHFYVLYLCLKKRSFASSGSDYSLVFFIFAIIACTIGLSTGLSYLANQDTSTLYFMIPAWLVFIAYCMIGHNAIRLKKRITKLKAEREATFDALHALEEFPDNPSSKKPYSLANDRAYQKKIYRNKPFKMEEILHTPLQLMNVIAHAFLFMVYIATPFLITGIAFINSDYELAGLLPTTFYLIVPIFYHGYTLYFFLLDRRLGRSRLAYGGMSIFLAIVCLFGTLFAMIAILDNKDHPSSYFIIPAGVALLGCAYIFIAIVFHFLKKHIAKILKNREEEFDALYPEETWDQQTT